MSVWRDQNRGVWIAKFWYQNRAHKKEGFRTRVAALGWQAQKRAELENPPPRTQIRFTFSQVSTKYLQYCSARMQRNTWRQKAFVYRSLLAFLTTDPPAGELTRTDLTAYLESRRRAAGAKAANRDLRDIKAMYHWAMRDETLGISRNPCWGIDRYPETRAIKYVPPADDIHAVLMAADQDDMDLLICLYHTGGRIGEIFRLIWDDVNFERKTVRLWTRKRRGGELEPDELAISPTLLAVLQRRWKQRAKDQPHVFTDPRTGAVINYQHKRDMMRHLCERAGVKPFGFHAIRHHVASILEDSGKATLGQIQKFLRHRRKTTTEIYLHSIERDLVEVAAILEDAGQKSDRISDRIPGEQEES